MCARLLNSPKTLSSHKTTAMTTTPFKMDLIVACIGIKRLTSHSKTPWFRQLDLAPFDLFIWPHPLVNQLPDPGRSEALRRP